MTEAREIATLRREIPTYVAEREQPTPGRTALASFLPHAIDMTSKLALAAGVVGGTVILRERRTRKRAERLAAATLETLLNAIEANDPQTGQHVRRVATYALVLADALSLDQHDRMTVERVALFHDIGKIHEALFDIIHDPNRLSRAERQAIATHPKRGADVLTPLATFYPELPLGVLAHHERWDGTGYPRGLRGPRIPLAARVVSIADTFDAVAHSRRYRKAGGVAEAERIIAAGRATQFDPAIVDVMLSPPVRDRIRRAHDAAHAPRRPGKSERRDAHGASSAPDVSFRWREEVSQP